LPKVLADPKAEEAAIKAAEEMAKLLKLPADSTEVIPGLEGYIIICLHKTPERTKEVLKEICRIFREAVKNSDAGIEIVIIPSHKKKWVKI